MRNVAPNSGCGANAARKGASTSHTAPTPLSLARLTGLPASQLVPCCAVVGPATARAQGRGAARSPFGLRVLAALLGFALAGATANVQAAEPGDKTPKSWLADGTEASAAKHTVSGSRLIDSALDREGITGATVLTAENYQPLTDATIKLFRFPLHADDPRARLAVHYLQMKHLIHKPMNFENALLADYLSLKNPSTRFGYSQYIGLPPLVQLARALRNIEIGSQLAQGDRESGVYLHRLAQTNKITRGSDRLGVTGCPEALWQLQLFTGQRYLGRIGFNFHDNHEKTVVSITNVQGGPKGVKADIESYEKHMDAPFGAALIELLRKKLAHELPHKEFQLHGRIYFEKDAQDKPYRVYRRAFRRAHVPVVKGGRARFNGAGKGDRRTSAQKKTDGG